MKQRLHVARTLLHDPDVLFLDEPTLGLDPVGAREFRQVILTLQSEKKTIFLTTHYMFEADALCDRIAVINHGCIIALDTPGGLKTHVRDLNVVEVETFGAPESVLEKLRALPFARFPFGGRAGTKADPARPDRAWGGGGARCHVCIWRG